MSPQFIRIINKQQYKESLIHPETRHSAGNPTNLIDPAQQTVSIKETWSLIKQGPRDYTLNPTEYVNQKL